MFETASGTVLSSPSTFLAGALTQNCVSAAMMALIAYDHALTFEEEVSLFWQRKFTLVTSFFFVNRYSALLYGILNLVSGFNSHPGVYGSHENGADKHRTVDVDVRR
ncbi:hypothetical protein PHLGIDRAFT_115423 [Phlebiopsis gigantea 11061_1 CR5-6]|uniref:DUF6533 domain-containing protein n=1 Tax=Phlebiopsis gigantea (strain 11061_1 CR5-6) TaxID=745531 RepID=A0A0C3PST2_PHLG1|nr:hypothetical protein PHLGIDRAFT_115423 [Phlebiopsis gigantea 11061_1 CR5-6]